MLPGSTSGRVALGVLGLAVALLLARLYLTPAVGLPLNFLIVFIAFALAALPALYAVVLRRDWSFSVVGTLAVGLLSATFLAAESLGGGGGTPQPAFGEADSGRTVTVSKGTQIMIQLPANPSTGYSWSVTVSNPGVVSQAGDPVFKPSSSALGAGGVYTVWFDATGSGKTDLWLDYRRSWEIDVQPVKTYVLHVVVG